MNKLFYNWSIVSFKVCVSLLIFCLVDLSIGVSGLLKSPTIIVLLLMSPFILVSICLTYCGAPAPGFGGHLLGLARGDPVPKGYLFLQQNIPSIQSLVHEVHGDAGPRFAVFELPEEGHGAAIPGEQRGVQINRATGRKFQECGGYNSREARDANEVGPERGERVEGPRQRIDGQGWNVMLPGEGDDVWRDVLGDERQGIGIGDVWQEGLRIRPTLISRHDEGADVCPGVEQGSERAARELAAGGHAQ